MKTVNQALKRVSNKKYPYLKDELYDLEFRNKMLFDENEKLLKQLADRETDIQKLESSLESEWQAKENIKAEAQMYKKWIDKLINKI